MRISYISGAYVPSTGANSMHAMRMCQAIAKQGHRVTLHVRPGDLTANDDFSFYDVEPCFDLVKTPRPNIRIIGAVVNAARTKQAVEREPQPDLLYGREFWALALLTNLGVPFVFESHWKPKTAFHKAVETAIMRHPRFRRVVLISEELHKIYRQEYPWLGEEKMVVAHDAADIVERVSPQRATEIEGAESLQVGYVGSFWPGYGIELIEAVAKRMRDVEFHVVGGDPRQVERRRALSSQQPNLTFHGFVDPRHLPGFYARFDIVLAPYQKETPHIDWISPMKLFEYMAYGKAIVCSDFPVMREIIQHGHNGLLVTSDDLLGWIEAIRSLRDEKRRNRIGSNARSIAERDFTWRVRARRVLEGLTD